MAPWAVAWAWAWGSAWGSIPVDEAGQMKAVSAPSWTAGAVAYGAMGPLVPVVGRLLVVLLPGLQEAVPPGPPGQQVHVEPLGVPLGQSPVSWLWLGCPSLPSWNEGVLEPAPAGVPWL